MRNNVSQPADLTINFFIKIYLKPLNPPLRQNLTLLFPNKEKVLSEAAPSKKLTSKKDKIIIKKLKGGH